tara:strand:- start:18927 stop:19586 length:660 start_codon:yes stop_codon:yes gene_type:complete
LTKIDIVDLPQIVPIFPLSGVLLLPHGRLPLNIFETRYLQMIEDVMSSHRMIGMVQPKNPMDKCNRPNIYPVGCIGKITSFSETEDNRYQISLKGIIRFIATDEMSYDSLLYRRVRVKYDSFSSDLSEQRLIVLDRKNLFPVLKSFFDSQGISANWEAINESDDADLLTNLAMICPFNPNEKQALLECKTSKAMADTLVSLIDMARHESSMNKYSSNSH